MRVIVIGVIAVLLVVGGIVVFGRSDDLQQATQDSQASEYAKVQDDLASKGARLYDVRTAEEYKAAHIKEAINLSLQDIEAGNMPDVAKDTKLYVYCRSGNRSAQAAELLRDAGYTNVVDLGGMGDVTSMGGELVVDAIAEVLP